MKNVMKTILRNTKLVMFLAFLPALLSAAQAQAVDYKSTYKGTQYAQPRQTEEYKVAATATAPAVGFQSTSAYSGQFGTEEQPMLNSDGTVNGEAYGVGQSSAPGHRGYIRKINNPGDDVENPLGEGVLALLMMAGSYAVARKRVKELKSERIKE